MADITISELDPIGALDGTEEFEVEKSIGGTPTSGKLSINDFLSLLVAAIGVPGSALLIGFPINSSGGVVALDYSGDASTKYGMVETTLSENATSTFADPDFSANVNFPGMRFDWVIRGGAGGFTFALPDDWIVSADLAAALAAPITAGAYVVINVLVDGTPVWNDSPAGVPIHFAKLMVAS